MRTHQIQQKSVALTEVGTASIECETDDQWCRCRDNKRHLVFYAYPTIKIGIKPAPMKLASGQKIRHLQSLKMTRSSIVANESVFTHVLIKNSVAVWKIQRTGRI